MKLTEENADYMDCRPLTDHSTMKLPSHLEKRSADKTLCSDHEKSATSTTKAATKIVDDNHDA